jgi:ABC-type phosphate/phosphonate transport system substrate-binding protein
MTLPRLFGVIAMLVVMALPGKPARAQSTARMDFIGVSIDSATSQADRRLAGYLYEHTGTRFAPWDVEYSQVIKRLVEWRPSEPAFVARVTPYAYVVAELLGANVEPFATYVSATTSRTTYRSYFVVKRSAAFAQAPGLSDLLQFLKTKRARFIYHNEFSTSSFFVPSLFFRSRDVFNMPEKTDRLTAIDAAKSGDGGSAGLVERVARGEADLAAVWDGVKGRFESDPALAATGRQVYFIELPTAIPNDLLVFPSALDVETKKKLKEVIQAMPRDAISVGDFLAWQNLTEATDARLALGDLRHAAHATSARVPVEIQSAKDAGPAGPALVEAARQAVRLSETEFVVYDADYHNQPDVTWTLEPIHDEAVVLHSTLAGYDKDIDEQTFQISFRDADDLTERVVSIIQSQLHRIRYVWSYGGNAPIVLRDNAFALPPGAPVHVQRITWVDPERNRFVGGDEFHSTIARTTFHRYDLAEADFKRTAAGERPDPLSNAAYRVVLLRPPDRAWLFRTLTAVLVALFVLAGVTAAYSLRRARGVPSSSPAQ